MDHDIRTAADVLRAMVATLNTGDVSEIANGDSNAALSGDA